jgi:cytochrome P450
VKSIYNYEGIVDLPYLNAILNESLRLHPVLPTAGIRQTATEGVMVAGTYIPPYTTIVTPRYSIARRKPLPNYLISENKSAWKLIFYLVESSFERAKEYIPERWTNKPGMVRDKRAFQPFNLGRHSCPGKDIGLMELRIVTAMLITKFKVSLAPGEYGLKVSEEMRDTFTAQPGDLHLKFKPMSEDVTAFYKPPAT